MAIPEDDRISLKMHEHGYVKGKTYFNFLEVVYGNKYISEVDDSVEIFYQKKKEYVMYSLWSGWSMYMIAI